MSNIVPFNFEGHSVRVFKDEWDEVVIVAKDLAEAIGYTWNGSARIQHVPDQWRGVTSVVTPSGEQDMAVLTEQGMYFFLARSDKPKALPFQMWLAGDVLPAVRKTGTYTAPAKQAPLAPALPNLSAVREASKTYRELVRTAKMIGQNINQAALSSSMAIRGLTGLDILGMMGITGLEAPDQVRTQSVTELGKQRGLSGQAMNRLLEEQGFQYRGEDKQWRPTEKGKPYSLLKDTTTKHHNGMPRQHLYWLESVLNVLDFDFELTHELVAVK